MHRTARYIVLGLCLTAGAALAHSGVKNAAVKARMQSMGLIATQTKVLASMSKGMIEFDAAQARDAARKIAKQAAKVPVLFEDQESDPKSEALPDIWAEFDDFTARSQELQNAARAAATEISTRDDLRTALGDIGGTCLSCHQRYRQ